jgi:GT2 family glycosyltransferase
LSASAQLPAVSLVVLNLNGRQHLGDCLPSLLELDYPADRLQLMVCDNGSIDGSSDYVRQTFPTVKVVSLEHNHGFAEANNLAAQEATGDWIGFLNNDMWAPRDWLRQLVAPIADRSGIASVASRIVNWDGSRIDFVGGSGANFQGYGFQRDVGSVSSSWDREGRVLYACGGAMLVRREVFLEVGGFDPDYFIYYEDVDLGWRLNVLGHDVWYAPAATVNHRHHGTTENWQDHRKQVLYDRNALSTMYKNLDDDNLAAALPASLLLLNEKALLAGGLKAGAYRMGPARPLPYGRPPETSERPGLFTRTQRVLASEGAAGMVFRATQRLAARQAAEQLPRRALSPLVAMSEFAHRLDKLVERRRWIQERRRRTDLDILPLFHFALSPAWPEPRYVEFQAWLRTVMGLDDRFGPGQDTQEG